MQATRMFENYKAIKNPRLSAFKNPRHPRSNLFFGTRMTRMQATRMFEDYKAIKNPRLSAFENLRHPRSFFHSRRDTDQAYVNKIMSFGKKTINPITADVIEATNTAPAAMSLTMPATG